MHDQSFSQKSLLKLVRKEDFYRFDLGHSKAERKEIVANVAAKICHPDYAFSPFRMNHVNLANVFSVRNLVDCLAIRKLNDNISRLFEIKQADRHRIVPQVKTLLNESGSYWARRLDIKGFYESIDRSTILNHLRREERLSLDSMTIAEKLLTHSTFTSTTGLPRGIALSATLSEMYMQEFDSMLKRSPDIYFYARYVDDIFILYHRPPEKTIAELQKLLPKGLSFNTSKCEDLHHPSDAPVKGPKSTIDYLGYEFKFLPKHANKASALEVGISQRKIKRIKTRIILALTNFSKNENFDLLLARVKFLTSNYRIASDGEQGNLYAGVHFNHMLVDTTRVSDFIALDKFLQSSIFCKRGSLGKRLFNKLNDAQRQELCRYSFKEGHTKKIVRKFTHEQMQQISAAWRHV